MSSFILQALAETNGLEEAIRRAQIGFCYHYVGYPWSCRARCSHVVALSGGVPPMDAADIRQDLHRPGLTDGLSAVSR